MLFQFIDNCVRPCLTELNRSDALSALCERKRNATSAIADAEDDRMYVPKHMLVVVNGGKKAVGRWMYDNLDDESHIGVATKNLKMIVKKWNLETPMWQPTKEVPTKACTDVELIGDQLFMCYSVQNFCTEHPYITVCGLVIVVSRFFFLQVFKKY